MLNISKNSVRNNIRTEDYKSFGHVIAVRGEIKLAKAFVIVLFLLLAISFLPWTQNIRAKGKVTTLKPDQRPQSLHSVIAGRIEKWYVKEGDYVKAGDTLLHISETKDDYFDPQFQGRMADQINAKTFARESYQEKVASLEQQISALGNMKILKLRQNRNKIEQAKLKVVTDSIDLEAEKISRSIAEEQFTRMQELYGKGLKSLSDLEARKMKFQESLAKYVSAENKLLSSRNELLNAHLELNNTEYEYNEKIAKARSDLSASLSEIYNEENEIAKLENKASNWEVRAGYYYITAPQDGYITRTRSNGIGELVKEGTEIASIMPSHYDLAAEIFVRPLDLPLLQVGQKVSVIFDGWPFIVFSGWPKLSTGSFAGTIVAIDNFAGPEGTFRVLLAPADIEKPWPEQLRVGSGANAFILLKNVPIWYELWRNINGFPPDFYEIEPSGKTPKKK